MDYLFSFIEEDIRQKKTESKLDRKTSLYKALDNRNTFKININSFRRLSGYGVELQGTVDFGVIRTGDEIKFNGQPGKIQKIESYGKTIGAAGYPWTDRRETIKLLITGIENETIYTGLQVIDIKKTTNSQKTESARVDAATPSYVEKNNADFTMEISDVFSIIGRGVVLAGRILSGEISVGDKVTVDGKPGTVSGIEKFRRLLDRASVNDGDIGLMISGIKREDASISSVVRKVQESKNAQTHSPTQKQVTHTGSTPSQGYTKATFVRIKPRVPISVKDLPTRNQNKLMNAITKYYNTLDNKDGIQHDGLGDILRLETDYRIYSINGDDVTYGLVLYIDMKDNTWRRSFRDIVEAYRFRYSGQHDPAVITVINSSPSDDQEMREIEEVEIRDSLIGCGIKGDDYPVIFCDVDRINSSNITNKYDDAYAPVVELLREIDAYFETPERK